MAVTIRLTRQGAKHKPNYLIVAVDENRKRDGLYLEKLGQYFPKSADPKSKVTVNMDAVQKWQTAGAQVSETVGQLLKIAAKYK